MLTVHHLENSRSLRIVWLLEELDLDYKIQHYKRDPETSLAPEELKNIHPLGKAPILTDSAGAHAESAYIIDYILRRYNAQRLLVPPKDSEMFDRYQFFMHYSEGSVMPILVMALVFNKIKNAKVPFFIKPIVSGIVHKVRQSYISPNMKLHLNYIEDCLSKNEWFAGSDFTAADIQMSFVLQAAAARDEVLKKYPNIRNFLDRIQQRPAYKKAIEKAGPLNITTD